MNCVLDDHGHLTWSFWHVWRSLFSRDVWKASYTYDYILSGVIKGWGFLYELFHIRYTHPWPKVSVLTYVSDMYSKLKIRGKNPIVLRTLVLYFFLPNFHVFIIITLWKPNTENSEHWIHLERLVLCYKEIGVSTS